MRHRALELTRLRLRPTRCISVACERSRIIREMAPVDSGELQAVLANDLGRRSGSRSRRIGVVPEPEMSVPQSVAEMLADHVTLEVEGIDRMYLNVYVPPLQREAGGSQFLPLSSRPPVRLRRLMDPISKAFVAAHGGVRQSRSRFRWCSSAKDSERTTLLPSIWPVR